MSEHIPMFANLKKRFLVIVLTAMMLSVPIAAFSTSLASASPMAGAGLIGNTGTLLSGAVSTFPYNQGFETGPANALINEANWGSNQWTYKASQKHSGNFSAGAAITTTGDDTRRLFVNVNFSANVSYPVPTSITYWYRISSEDTNHRLMRLIGSINSTNGTNGTWFVLRDWTDITYATSWTQFYANDFLNLSKFAYQSNCYIKIQVKNMSGHNQRTLYIDDFHIGCGTSYGPEAEFNSDSPDGTGPSVIVRLDSSRALIVYDDYGNNGFGTARVANISGSTITSVGPEYVFYQNGTPYFSATALDSNRVLIAYEYYSGQGAARIATISGNTVAYGSTYVFNYSVPEYISVTTLDSNRVLIAYRVTSTGGYGIARVANISGSTITSVGPEYTFNNAYTANVSATALSSSQAVIAYRGGNGYGTARLATVSGSTISCGAVCGFNNATTDLISVAALDSSRALIAYQITEGTTPGRTQLGIARVAHVSGTTIVYSEAVAFHTFDTFGIRATALGSSRVLIAYRDGWNNSNGTSILIGITGDYVSGIGPEPVFNPATTYFISATSLDFCHALISYHDDGNDSRGTAIVAAI